MGIDLEALAASWLALPSAPLLLVLSLLVAYAAVFRNLALRHLATEPAPSLAGIIVLGAIGLAGVQLLAFFVVVLATDASQPLLQWGVLAAGAFIMGLGGASLSTWYLRATLPRRQHATTGMAAVALFCLGAAGAYFVFGVLVVIFLYPFLAV